MANVYITISLNSQDTQYSPDTTHQQSHTSHYLLYCKGQQDDSLYTEHKEMIISWKTLAHQLIIARVFNLNEEYGSTLSCMTLICVVCEFVRHRVDERFFFMINNVNIFVKE